MLSALFLVPFIAGGIAFIPGWSRRPWILPVTGILHFALVAFVLRYGAESSVWLELDALGRLFLMIVSAVFLVAFLYAPGYLALRADRPNRLICACLPVTLGCATLVILSRHLGLLWVAMELMTISAAPLLYFNRTPRSIEATWKYLVIGSVGIALALLGAFFLSYAAHAGGARPELGFPELMANAPRLSRPWVRASFVLFLVGFGAKMGLAPLHTWKPDAYGEAPGVVGAVLAGGLTNVAFLALLRVFGVAVAAGEGAFARGLMTGIGLFSMAVAAFFMIRQKDLKRLLAYSSVEHMGILVLGTGIGGLAAFGALLHAVNNALAKCLIFLAAGNIQRAYGSKNIDAVAGALRRLPVSAALFLAAFFAVTGSPPFGIFMSEMTILTGAFQAGRAPAALLFLFFLAVIFIGMSRTILSALEPSGPEPVRRDESDTSARNLPLFLALLPVLLLGLWLPDPLRQLLAAAARSVQGAG